MRYTPISQVWLSPELPDEIADVLEAVESDLSSNDERPLVRVLGIESDWEDEDTDGENLVLRVEIVPGLIPPYRHSDDSDLPLEEATDWIVEEVRRGVEAACLASDRYSEAANRVRHEATRIMADWQAEGLPASFAGLLMEEHQGWHANGNPRFSVEIEVLGNRLKPTTDFVHVGSAAELQTALAPVHERLRRRNDVRIALGRSGSDGLIDDMLLSALLREDKPHNAFQRLLLDDMVVLGDGTVVVWNDGEIVWQHDRDFGGRASVCGGTITMRGVYLDAQTSLAVVGQPASTVFEHPMLTDDVRIASIKRYLDRGAPMTEATLAMTFHNFCAATGRTWPQTQDAATHARRRPILRIV